MMHHAAKLKGQALQAAAYNIAPCCLFVVLLYPWLAADSASDSRGFMWRLKHFIPAVVSAAVVAAQTNASLVPLVFEPFPLGSIQPQGWLRDEMQLMADGLAGHEHDFYYYVNDSTWLGGSHEYSGLNEGFPYWFNGLVPLAYGLYDPRLIAEVRSAADYVIDHQAEDGWLGPETGTARNLWGRMPFLLGLIQMAEADATYRDKILPAMYKYNNLVRSMLKNNYTGYLYHEGDELDEGDYQWGRNRVQDMMVSLQWLYEKYPGNSSIAIMENLQMLFDGAINWADWFVEGVYIKEDLNTFVTDPNPLFPYEHGVNAGQGLKAAAVYRRFTHNDTLLQTARIGVNWTFAYHGAASGTILADERLGGLAPYYGSELCTAVETMYSLSYLYQAIGDNDFADKCELAAFNALPVMMTPDWWAHQYMAEPNQPYSKNLTDTPFWNVNSWGQSYGLEPNYPCCTVNHPQGYPKFASASFVKVGDSGVAHALLAPATVASTLANSHSFAIQCDTNYPFSNTLSYQINASFPMNFYVRVPSWADLTTSTITNTTSNTATSLSPDPQTGLHKITLPGGRSYLTYTIGAPVEVEARANDTVAVRHGALLYALDISSTNTSTPPKAYNTKQEFPAGYAPSQSRDYQISNTSSWAVAIDASTLKLHTPSDDAAVTLSNPIFAPGAPATYMTVQACEIAWGLFKGVPATVPSKDERKCFGEAYEVRLRPYGSTKIHMAELPTIDLGG